MTGGLIIVHLLFVDYRSFVTAMGGGRLLLDVPSFYHLLWFLTLLFLQYLIFSTDTGVLRLELALSI